jgi:hypothetical protein
MNAPSRKWTISEEAAIVRMRRENACAKMIGRKLDRSPECIASHVQVMKQRAAPAHSAQHRAEEMGLLERLLNEARLPSDLA